MHYNVVYNYGESNFPDLYVCAKTGTAEVGGGLEPNATFAGFTMDDEYPPGFCSHCGKWRLWEKYLCSHHFQGVICLHGVYELKRETKSQKHRLLHMVNAGGGILCGDSIISVASPC